MSMPVAIVVCEGAKGLEYVKVVVARGCVDAHMLQEVGDAGFRVELDDLVAQRVVWHAKIIALEVVGEVEEGHSDGAVIGVCCDHCGVALARIRLEGCCFVCCALFETERCKDGYEFLKVMVPWLLQSIGCLDEVEGMHVSFRGLVARRVLCAQHSAAVESAVESSRQCLLRSPGASRLEHARLLLNCLGPWQPVCQSLGFGECAGLHCLCIC
jgi:hypothetical protein